MKSLMVCVNLENDSINGLKEKLAKITMTPTAPLVMDN